MPLRHLLRGLVEAMVRFHTTDASLHRVLFEEAPHPPEVHAELKALEERFSARVEALLRAHPEAARRDPSRAAYMAVHIVESLAHHYVLHPTDALSPSAFVDELVAVLERYLAA